MNKRNSNLEVNTRSTYGLLLEAAYTGQCFISAIPERQAILVLLINI